MSFLPTHKYALYTKMGDDNNIPNKLQYSHYNFLPEMSTYLLHADIANQVSVDERKNNPVSPSSGLTVTALTANSVSTPTTKYCQYFTHDSLSANNGPYCVKYFDQRLYLPVNCKVVTGKEGGKIGRDVDKKVV